MEEKTIRLDKYDSKTIISNNYRIAYYDEKQIKSDEIIKGPPSLNQRQELYLEFVKRFEKHFGIKTNFRLMNDKLNDYFDVALSDSVSIDLESVGEYLLELKTTRKSCSLGIIDGLLKKDTSRISNVLNVDSSNIINGIARLICMTSSKNPETRDKNYLMHQVLHVMYCTVYKYIIRPESSIKEYTGVFLTPDLQGVIKDLELNGVHYKDVLVFSDFKNTTDVDAYSDTIKKYFYPGLSAMYASDLKVLLVNIVDVSKNLINDVMTDVAKCKDKFALGVYYSLYLMVKFLLGFWTDLPTVNLAYNKSRFIPTTIDLPELNPDSILAANEEALINNFVYGIYTNQLSSCQIPLKLDLLNSLQNDIKNKTLSDKIMNDLIKNITTSRKSIKKEEGIQKIMTLANNMRLDNIDSLVSDYRKTGICNIQGIKIPNYREYNPDIDVDEVRETLKNNLNRFIGNFVSVEIKYDLADYKADTIEEVSQMVNTIRDGKLTCKDISDTILETVLSGNDPFSNPIDSCKEIIAIYDRINKYVRTNNDISEYAPSFPPFCDETKGSGVQELGEEVLYENNSEFALNLAKINNVFSILPNDTRIPSIDTREKIYNAKASDIISEILYMVDVYYERHPDELSIDAKDKCAHIKRLINKVLVGEVEHREMSDKLKELDKGKDANTFYWRRVNDVLGIVLPHYDVSSRDSETDYLIELCHIINHHGSVCKFCGNSTTQAKISTLQLSEEDLGGMSAKDIKIMMKKGAGLKVNCDIYNKIERLLYVRQKYKAMKGCGEIVGLLEKLAKTIALQPSELDIEYIETEMNKKYLKNYLNKFTDNLAKSLASGEAYEVTNEYYRVIDSPQLREAFNIGCGNYKTDYIHKKPKNVVCGYDDVDRFLDIIRNIDDDKFKDYLKNVLKLYNNVIMDAARIGKRLNCYIRKSFKSMVYFMTYNTDGYKIITTYDKDYFMKNFNIKTTNDIILLFGQALVTDKTVSIRYNLTDFDIYSVERAMSYFSIWKLHEAHMKIPHEKSMYKFIATISLKNRFNTCTLLKLLRYFIPNITQDKNNIASLFKDKMLDNEGDLAFYSYDMVTTTLFKLYRKYCTEVLKKYVYRQDKSILYGIYNSADTEDKDAIKSLIDEEESVRNRYLYAAKPKSKTGKLENPLVGINNDTSTLNPALIAKLEKYFGRYTTDKCIELSKDKIDNIFLYFFNPEFQVNDERIFTDMAMLYHLQYGGSQNYKVASRELIDKIVEFDAIYLKERSKDENYCSISGLNKILNKYALKHGYKSWYEYFNLEPKKLYKEFYNDFIKYEPDGPSKVMKIDPFAMVLFTVHHCDKYNITKFDHSKLSSDIFSIIKNKAMSNFEIDEYYKANTIDFNEFVVNNPFEYFNPDRDYIKYAHVEDLDTGKPYSERTVYFNKDDIIKMGKDKIMIQKLSTLQEDKYVMSIENYHKIAWLTKRKGKKLRLNNMVHILILHMMDDIFKKTGFYKIGHEALSQEEISNLLLYSGYDISTNGSNITLEKLEDIEAALIEKNLTYYKVIDKYANHKFVFSVAFKDETGGNREFYIANLPARLCVNLLDKSFVQFCESSGNEFISVPGNTKMDSIYHTIQSVFKKDSKEHTTVLASCDCSKWSNKAFMLEYKVLLITMACSGIFTLEDTEMLFNIMTKMEYKWVEVPALYVENKMTTTEHFIYYAGKYFIEIYGSWLQGQINFLSSFKHAICASMITFILQSINEDNKVYSFVHSDDSAYIFYGKNTEGKSRDVLGCWLINCIKICYNAFNQCINEKKTSTGGFMEFCSVFYTQDSCNSGLSRLVRIEYTPTTGNPFADMISYFSKVRIWRYQGIPYVYLYDLLNWMKFIWKTLTPFYGLTPYGLNPSVYSVCDIVYSDMLTIVKPYTYLKEIGIDPDEYYSEMIGILAKTNSDKIDKRLFSIPKVKSSYSPPDPKSPITIRNELNSYGNLMSHILSKVSNILDITYLHDKYPEFDVLNITERIPAFKALGIIDIYFNHNFLMSFTNMRANEMHIERFKVVSNLYIEGEFLRKFIREIPITQYTKMDDIWNSILKYSTNPVKDQYRVISTNVTYCDNMLSGADKIEEVKSHVFTTMQIPGSIRNKMKYYDIYGIMYSDDPKVYRQVLRKEIEMGIVPRNPPDYYRNIANSICPIDRSSLENLRSSKLKLCSMLELGNEATKTGMVLTDGLNLKKFPITLDSYMYLDGVDTASYNIMVSNYVLNIVKVNKSTNIRYHLDRSVLMVDNKPVVGSMNMSRVSNGTELTDLYANGKLSKEDEVELHNVLQSERYLDTSYILGYRDYRIVHSLRNNAKYYLNEDKTLDDFSLIVYGISNVAAAFEKKNQFNFMKHLFINRNDCGHPVSIFPIPRTVRRPESIEKYKDQIVALINTHFLTNITWEEPRLFLNMDYVRKSDNKSLCMKLYGHYVIFTSSVYINVLNPYQIVISVNNKHSVMVYEPLFSKDFRLTLAGAYKYYDPDMLLRHNIHQTGLYTEMEMMNMGINTKNTWTSSRDYKLDIEEVHKSEYLQQVVHNVLTQSGEDLRLLSDGKDYEYPFNSIDKLKNIKKLYSVYCQFSVYNNNDWLDILNTLNEGDEAKAFRAAADKIVGNSIEKKIDFDIMFATKEDLDKSAKLVINILTEQQGQAFVYDSINGYLKDYVVNQLNENWKSVKHIMLWNPSKCTDIIDNNIIKLKTILTSPDETYKKSNILKFDEDDEYLYDAECLKYDDTYGIAIMDVTKQYKRIDKAFRKSKQQYDELKGDARSDAKDKRDRTLPYYKLMQSSLNKGDDITCNVIPVDQYNAVITKYFLPESSTSDDSSDDDDDYY